MSDIRWRIARYWMPVLVAGLMVFAGGAARAEGLRVLTLDEIVQMALETSPQLKEADQDIKAAQGDLAQARGGQWAQLDVVAIGAPSEDAKKPIVRIDPVTNIGHIEDRDEGDVGIFGSLDFFIVQPLYTFGKISNRREAAALGVEVQKAIKEQKKGEVILTIKEMYYGLVVATQGKSASQDAEEFVKDARRRIERLLEAGSKNVDRSDLYRLEAYEAEIKQFQVKADTGAQLAYMALKRAINYPAGEDFRLDTRELPKNVRQLGSLEEYIQQALAERPEFEQLKKGIQARKAMVEGARADLYPSIFVAGVGSFAGAPGREKLDISYFHDEFNHVEAGAFLGANWHFDLGIGQGKLARARAEHQKLVHTKEYAERNIPVEVAKYYQEVVESQAAYENYGKGTVAARKWVVSSFSSFDVGVGTAKDMFDAIDRYGKNQGEYLSALYKYNVSLARLSHAIAEYRTGGS